MSAEPGLWDGEVVLGQASGSKQAEQSYFNQCREIKPQARNLNPKLGIFKSAFGFKLYVIVYTVCLCICQNRICPVSTSNSRNVIASLHCGFCMVGVFLWFVTRGCFLTWRPPSHPVMFAWINRNAQWLKFTWGFEPHHPSPPARASILVCTAKSWTDSVQASRFINLC